ncbi:MAG TPA: hypothetical protein PKM59_08140 [Thermodesulfobacteriota bacterium]|nr:hypothetical protein [Thermodesulfobacteriota bacterium]HNU70785.1 hypothetical protein [Thermodesulfobacteriota bacterium]
MMIIHASITIIPANINIMQASTIIVLASMTITGASIIIQTKAMAAPVINTTPLTTGAIHTNIINVTMTMVDVGLLKVFLSVQLAVPLSLRR